MAEGDVTPTKGALSLDVGTAIRMLLKAMGRVIKKSTPKRIVTLDIDSTSIRLLETIGGTVKKWSSISFEPGEVEGGVVSEPPALGTVVKQLMTSSGIKAKKVVVSLNGLHSISRILPMSTLPVGLTTQEAVLEVATEIMPFSMDQLYLSWQTIAVGEGEEAVLAVGVLRDVVDGEVQALRAMGITPRILELKTMALARAVNKEQALILNIEPASFDIIVVANGIPEIMRTIAWQPDDLTQEDKVEQLTLPLELTVDFYNSHHPAAPLDPTIPLFITGQMSADLTLMEELQARLGYPIEPLAPPLKHPAHLPVSQYAVNIGLALREAVPSKNREPGEHLSLDINLLPEIYRPWRPTAIQLFAFALIIAALGLIFPLLQLATGAMGTTANLQTKSDSLNTQLQLKQVEIREREPIQKAINDYHTIINLNQVGNFTEDIAVINREAERLGVVVGPITHAGGSISFSAQADDYIAFREYLTALEESGRFSTPIPPPERYPYTTSGTIELEPVTGEEASD